MSEERKDVKQAGCPSCGGWPFFPWEPIRRPWGPGPWGPGRPPWGPGPWGIDGWGPGPWGRRGRRW